MRKWFSFEMFKEGLRQLRLAGLSVIAVFTVLNLLPPISIWSFDTSSWEVRALEWGIYGVIPTIFSVVAPILLCSVLFRFVMRRSDSDFYGALPFTRQSVFSGFTAAVFVYVVGGIVLSVLSSVFLFWLMGCYIIALGKVVLVTLTLITAAMLVMGALLVGIMLCGRLFNAFFTGGLLLCLPRAVATMFLVTCMNIKSWQLSPETVLLPQVLQQNTLIKMLTSWAIDKADVFPWQSILYSFILALIYIVLAGVLFYYRKTEIAGESVPRPWLQVVCRLGISLPLMLFFTMMLLLGQGEQVAMVMIGILCLLVYYVYELLTTKSWRRLVPATGWLLASVGVCLVFSGAVVGYNRYHIGIKPAKEEIAYVSFIRSPNFVETRDYMTEELKQVRFEEASVRQMVSSALQTRMMEETPLNRTYASANARVKIVLKNGKTYYRRIFLSELQFEMILSTNKTYKSILAGLPPKEEFAEMICERTIITDKAVYDVFYKEFMALPENRRMDLHTDEVIYSDHGISVGVYLLSEGKRNDYSFCLTAKEFPKTLCEIAKRQDTTVIRYWLDKVVSDNATAEIYAKFYCGAYADGVFEKEAEQQLLSKLLSCVTNSLVDKTPTGFLQFITDDAYEYCLVPLSEEDYTALHTLFSDASDTNREKIIIKE